jgi:hypothetical protein
MGEGYNTATFQLTFFIIQDIYVISGTIITLIGRQKFLVQKRWFLLSSLQTLQSAIYYIMAALYIITRLKPSSSWEWGWIIFIHWVDDFHASQYGCTTIIENWYAGRKEESVTIHDCSMDTADDTEIRTWHSVACEHCCCLTHRPPNEWNHQVV